MKSVIVTGANGFIGSSLIKTLSENKVKVYAVVRTKERAKNILDLENVDIIECEMRDYLNLNKVIWEKLLKIRVRLFTRIGRLILRVLLLPWLFLLQLSSSCLLLVLLLA